MEAEAASPRVAGPSLGEGPPAALEAEAGCPIGGCPIAVHLNYSWRQGGQAHERFGKYYYDAAPTAKELLSRAGKPAGFGDIAFLHVHEHPTAPPLPDGRGSSAAQFRWADTERMPCAAARLLDPEDDKDENRIEGALADVTPCPASGLRVIVFHGEASRMHEFLTPVDELVRGTTVGDFTRRASKWFTDNNQGPPFEYMVDDSYHGRADVVDATLELRHAVPHFGSVTSGLPVLKFWVDVRGNKFQVQVPCTATVADMIKAVNDWLAAERVRDRPRVPVVALERMDGALLDAKQPILGYVLPQDRFYGHTEHDESMIVAPVTARPFRGGCEWRPKPSAASALVASVADALGSLWRGVAGAGLSPPRPLRQSAVGSTDSSPESVALLSRSASTDQAVGASGAAKEKRE